MTAYAAWAVLVVVAAAIVRASSRCPVPAWATRASWLAMPGAAIVMLVVTRGTPLGDFLKAYYRAGHVVLSNPAALYECEVSNLCFVNLPIVAVAFAPFAWLPPWIAGVAFSAVALAATGFGAWMLTARGERPARAPAAREIALWMVVLSGPLYYSIRLGNTTHVLLPLLVVAFDRLAHRAGLSGGAALGLLAIVKPPLALFLPYLVLRGRLVAAVGMTGAMAGLVALSVAVFGWPLHVRFWTDIVVGFAGGPIAAYNVQSVSGAIAHLLWPGHLRDFEPLPSTPTFAALRVASSAAATALVVVACWRSGPPSTREAHVVELSMVLALALLVAPLAWTHYFLLLLVPCTAFASGALAVEGRARRAAWWAACVLLALPSTFFTLPWTRLAAIHERLFASHYTAGAALLLCLLAVQRVRRAPAAPGSRQA